MNTKSIVATKEYSIVELSRITETNEQFLRKLIREGRIKTRKVQIRDTMVEKHMILGQSVLDYADSTKTRTSRDDGRNKYTLYANPAELEKIQKLLESAGIETPIIRTNEGVYEKRKAAKTTK
jgi:ribosomal protein S8